MENSRDIIRDWIKRLEESVKFDPDEGDPILCLEEVEYIIKEMKEKVNWL